MEQTITPEEHPLIVDGVHDVFTRWMTGKLEEASDPTKAAWTLAGALGAAIQELDARYHTISSVRQEALAQGWDEASMYVYEVEGKHEAARRIAESNPHRNAA